jgi:hypothetical protein
VRSQSALARASGWAITGFFSLAMLGSGTLYLIGPPQVAEVFRHLGYPDYFRSILGVAKILGVATILFGRHWPTLREWAYAGFTFDFFAASLSHAIRGDGAAAIMPLVALALLTGSYLLWYLPRREEPVRYANT